MSVSLPRFFVPRSDTLAFQPPLCETIWAEDAIDAFYLEGRPAREWVAATCVDGGLRLLPVAGELPDSVKEQLAAFEVAGGSVRRLNLEELWLLAVRLVDTSQGFGLNRPVKLCGTLYGPFGPNHSPRDVQQVEGELLINQAELLDAIATDAPMAFRYPANRDERFFHLTLAGDHEDDLRAGNGVILAYPMLPPELCLDGVTNQTMVRSTLRDVLIGIHGEPQKGFNPKAELSKWLTSFVGRKVSLTTQNTLEESLQLAQETLKSYENWPTPRVAALRQRLAARPAPVAPTPPPPPSVHIPKPTPIPPPPDYENRPDLSRTPRGNAEWAKDFSAPPSRPIPKGSPPTAKPKPKSAPPARSESTPDWMKDFQ